MLTELRDNPQYQAALAIVRKLRDAGHQAYFAGGCVRDLLLDIAPKDFDVATSAKPEEVLALFPRTFTVGAHFGVILVCDLIAEREVQTEVATFRHDGAYSDGRRPDAVQFSTSPEEDVQRRDFTINGMLLDPVRYEREIGADSQCEALNASILDFVGGRADLEARILRAIGDPVRRFAEDKLRILRAVRFAARFHFTIEPATFAAIRQHAADIHQVSAERIRDELTRILTEGAARHGFELMDAAGLLHHILPEITRMHGVEQPPQYHPEGDVWVHTMLLLEKLPRGCSATVAWGALLHDVGKPATFRAPAKPGDRIRFDGHVEVGVRVAEEILRRLRFSGEDAAQIVALVKNHMRFGDILEMKQSTLKRFFRLDRFEEHLALHHMDVMSAHGDLRLYDFAKQHYEAAEPEAVRPKLLLTGWDLIAAGYRPGPQFKAMLDFAEDAQLESTIHSTEEALMLVRKHFEVE